MSQALYDHGGLRFWSESEIDARESAIKSLALAIRNALPCTYERGRVRINGDWIDWDGAEAPRQDGNDRFAVDL